MKAINHLPCPRHSPLVCALYLQSLEIIALEGSAILILEGLGGMKILHLGFANGTDAGGDCLLCHCRQNCVATTSTIVMNSYEEKLAMAAVFRFLWLWRFIFFSNFINRPCSDLHIFPNNGGEDKRPKDFAQNNTDEQVSQQVFLLLIMTSTS